MEFLRRIPDHLRRFTSAERRGVNESVPQDYLRTLSLIDRARVADFVGSRSLRTALGGNVRLGVLAVGSTVRPKSLRHHEPGDIDLVILNSAPPNSEERKASSIVVATAIRDYIVRASLPWEETGDTMVIRMVEASGVRELVPALTWEVGDPAFRAVPEEGLPLHISLVGLGKPDLDRFINAIRESQSHFSVLMYDKPFA